MLQPRMSLALLLMLLLAHGRCSDVGAVRQTNYQAPGDVVLAAATFVREGTTTEFATGRVGRGRTQVVAASSSRVSFDRRQQKPLLLVFPTTVQPPPPLPTETVSVVAATPVPEEIYVPPPDPRRVNTVAVPDRYRTVEELRASSYFPPPTNPDLTPDYGEPSGEDADNFINHHGSYPSSDAHAKRDAEQGTDEVIKPAKVAVVQPVNDLPTFTVRHDFSPSGYSSSSDEDADIKKKEKQRSGKVAAIFRGGKPDIPLRLQKLRETYTYHGFADFTTTIGDTVVIFMPSTTKQIPQASKKVTYLPGEEPPAVVTKVKTFMLHTPGMVTRTVTGHSLTMQTTVPTMVVLPEVASSRRPKAEETPESVYVVEAAAPLTTQPTVETPPITTEQQPLEETTQDEAAKSAVLSREQELFDSPATVVDEVAFNTPEFPDSPTAVVEGITPTATVGEYEDYDQGTSETLKVPGDTTAIIEPSTVAYEVADIIEPSPVLETPQLEIHSTHVVMDSSPPDEETVVITTDEVKVSPTAPVTSFRTAKTQLFDNGGVENPIGLIKVIAGTEAINGTTTLFTSLIHGTIVNSQYAQIIHSKLSIFYYDGENKIEITPTSNIAPTTTAKLSDTTSIANKIKNDEPEKETTTSPPTIPDEGPVSTTDGNTITTHEEEGETLSTMPFDVTTTDADLSNEVETGRKISASSKDQILVSDTDKLQNEKLNDPTTTEQGTTAGDDKYDTKPLNESPIQPEERPTENFITQIIPSTVYKTFTVLTTFFIPTDGGTTTSLKSREVITSEVKLATKILKEMKTQIQPTTTLITQPATTTPQTTDRVTTQPVENTSEDTVPTSPNPATLSESVDSADDDTTELIYKTLYTTYTFYTTFFQGDTTSVASREQVETNIITSTIDRDFFLRATDPAVAGLFTRENNLVESTPLELAPTSVGIGRPTTKFFQDSPQIPDDNLFSTVIDSVDVEKEMAKPTPVLNLVAINSGDDVIKTFYTTYTYFTTIFVDGETTVTSRTEVYTNIVKPSGLLLATPAVKEIQKTAQPELLLDQVEAPQRHVPVVSETPVLKVTPKIQYSSTIIRDRVQSSLNEVDNVPTSTPEITTTDLFYSGDDEENSIIPQKTPGIKYATVTRPQAQNVTSSVFETLVSSSGGAVDTIILNKENKIPDRNIVILDDQISSESNTESVDPAPTLLLQTSYTTYTYFTTVYKGPITDVLSRLETVTNVVTETLTPQRTVLLPDLSETEDDPLLPTTYFTTYTYWTTQYKGGSTVVTSREETVSNVVTPTVEPAGGAITTTVAPTTVEDVVTPTEVIYEPTTYYTTFTYFTTSIIGNSTIINSNFQTVTNIVNGTVDNTDGQVARAVGTTAKPQEIETTNTVKEKIEATAVQANNKTQQLLPTGRLSTIVSTQINEGVTTLFSTDVFGTYIDGLYAQVLESSTKIVTPEVQPTSTATPQLPKQPVGVVSLNYGRIVDADGVSTTFYTTKDIGTYIDQLYARVIESTSTVTVNTERQAALQLATPTKTEGAADKAHQTGLVRIIDGTAVFEGTTTFYESKVIGTYVNGRYAQIIESTSTFKVAMTSTPVPNDIIAATATLQDTVVPTSLVTTTSPLPTVVESSLGESEQESKEEESHSEEEGEDSEDDDKDSGKNKNRVKSRLTAPTRKRTFTPAIRPFSSRNRATFNPKRKTIAVTSATTITRTTVTPTVTATPAAKTGNRFANNRRGSTLQNNDVRPTAVTGAGSGGRRFNRVKSSSQNAQAGVFSSSYPGGGRGRSTARVTPTVAVGVVGSSRRGGGFFRPSTTAGRGVSSAGYFPAGSSSRYNRIRPTQAAVFGGARASLNPATAPSVNEETLEADDFTTSLVTDETPQYTDGAEGESPTLALPTTTEPPQKRNPLLRFRRPPLLRSTSTTPRTTSTSRGTTSPRRGGNNNRATTTTTAKPKPRPTIRYQPVANRARPGNGLFPPRGLFKRPEPEEDLLEENAEEEEEESKNEDRGDEEIQENGEGDFADEDEEGIRDNDYEGSERKESKAKKSSSVNVKPVQIRPFVGFRKRVKRQADYGSKREGGSRSYSSRFRRPGGRGAQQQQEEPATPEPPPPPPPAKSKSNGGGRFTPRPRTQQTQQVATQNQRVKPTAASTNAGRSQFTLREKDSGTPRYRRPTNSNTGTTPSRRRGKPAADTSVPSRPKPPRLRTQSNTNQQTETTYSRTNNRRYNGNTQARRTTSRNGYKNRDSTAVDSFTYSQPTFDGTITVTHRIPEEVTIPVVNGKVTEYRNVVTARPSLEVLAPHQYTTSTGKDGGTVLVLTSEVTGTLPGGATEITQYLLRETQTTSIIFTPTTIRGRFTSFSHIIPSTVYDVEQVVNTVQPQIAANAPLANILLSQLLLGNLGGLQPNINPFLALNNQQQQQQTPPSPTTEYKTRATTYVTTLTKGRSTVIPLTFRGKEILTTIVDSSEEVITATEFITDTIVITPTATINNQLNSLLIPALLQAQILGNTPQTLPQQQAPNILPGLQITPDLTQPPKGLLFQEPENSETEVTSDHQTRRSSNGKSRHRTEDTDRSVKDSALDVPDVDAIQAAREDEVRTWKPPRKKSTRNNNAERKPPDPPPAETSVVTLYVSGRRPGEFSTVVSTVTLGDDSSIKKREIRYLPKVLASQVPEIGSSFPDVDDDDYLDNYLMPAMNDLAVESSEIETQSLESIVGDVSRYISVDLMTPTRGGHNAKPSLTAHNTNPSLSKDDVAHSTNNKKEAGHFLSQGPAELAPLKRKVVKYSNRGLDLLEESSIDALSSQEDSVVSKNSRQRRSAVENSNQTNNSPSRHRARVIKLRRPIGKSNNSDEIETNNHREVLTLSEAQQSEDVTEMHLTTTHSKPKVKHINLSDYGRRTVKIIRHPNSNNTNELSRKRIIVARKRVPVGSFVQSTAVLKSAHVFEDEEEIPTMQTVNRHLSPEIIEASKTQGRRRIKVTKKRPVTHQPITPTTSSHRRRVVVTRRRPVHNDELEDIIPTSAVVTKIPAFTYATLSRQNKITSPVPSKPTQSPQIEEALENDSVEPTEGQMEEYILDDYIPTQHTKNSEYEKGTETGRGKINLPNSLPRRPSTTELPKGFESDEDEESAGRTSQTIDDTRGLYESNEQSTEDIFYSPTTEVLKSKQNAEYEITTVAKDYLPINRNQLTEKPVRPVFSVGIIDSKTTQVVSNNTRDTVFVPEYTRNDLTNKPTMITTTTDQDKTGTNRPLLTTEESLIPSSKFYVTEENQITTIKGDGDKVQNITNDDSSGVSIQHSSEAIERGLISSEEGAATDGASEGRDITTQNVVALEGTHGTQEISTETTITTPLSNGDEDLNAVTTPETVTESTYDGPRFIRPTRFSVTRKPQRTRTTFPGQRRRTSTPVLTTSTPTTTEIAHTKSTPYRFRKTSSTKTFGKSTTAPRFHGKSTRKQPDPTPVVDSPVADVTPTETQVLPEKLPIPETTVMTTEIDGTTSTIDEDLGPTATPQLTPTVQLLTSTRLRTFTYIVTRVAGDEVQVTSTTEVKPHVTIITRTVDQPIATALPTITAAPAVDEGRALNVATRKMSNGVEVIVAGGRTTMPGVPTPTTLAATTLTDHVMLRMPENDDVQPTEPPFDSDAFVTKTYLTTYTYLTTLMQDGKPLVTSSERVVSNVATEYADAAADAEPTTGVVVPTEAPALATSVLRTTYTYLTVGNEEKSERVVLNTVTAPPDVFQRQPAPPVTNTYLTTMLTPQTLAGGEVVSSSEVITRLVITRTEPPLEAAMSTTDVVKTYFATYTYFSTEVDDRGSETVHTQVVTSTDVVTDKFYLTSKRTTQPIKATERPPAVVTSQKVVPTASPPEKQFFVFATKTYLTTFTYFTTLLQDGGKDKTSTIVNSRTKVVQNIVTETIPPSLLGAEYLDALRSSFRMESTTNRPIVAMATLSGGQEVKITAMEEDMMQQIQATAVGTNPTATVAPTVNIVSSMDDEGSTTNVENIVTGSTIIFFDDEDQIDSSTQAPGTEAKPTPTLDATIPALNADLILTSVINTGSATVIFPQTTTDSNQQVTSSAEVADDMPENTAVATAANDEAVETLTVTTLLPTSTLPLESPAATDKPEAATKRPGTVVGPGGNEIQVSDLLSLGSLGINGLNALGPVFNAMAGLIQGNLYQQDSNRRNDTGISGVTYVTPSPRIPQQEYPRPVYVPSRQPEKSTQDRSPIYIPVGGIAADYNRPVSGDIEIAESQNYEGHIHLNGNPEDVKWVSTDDDVQTEVSENFPDAHRRTSAETNVVLGRPTMEKPLLGDGIPISPGEVITANSDVIIGKPAVMGPRPPKLSNEADDIPIGMRPPPIPSAQKWIQNIPHNKDEFIGPPPPLPPQPPRDNRPNHNNRPNGEQHYRIHEKLPSPLREQHLPGKRPQIQIAPHRTSVMTGSQTVLLAETGGSDIIQGNPIPNLPHHERIPIIHPADHTSLLVNIQPSQVAKVIIPHGSSTAHVFSAPAPPLSDNEFYDPSPFPLPEVAPEFVGLGSLPQLGSVDGTQHGVGTVIEVHAGDSGPSIETPSSDIGGNSDINVNIAPGQGIKVDVSSGHHENHRIQPSGIVLDAPLNPDRLHENRRPPVSQYMTGNHVRPPSRPTNPAHHQRFPSKPHRPTQYMTPPSPPPPASFPRPHPPDLGNKFRHEIKHHPIIIPLNGNNEPSQTIPKTDEFSIKPVKGNEDDLDHAEEDVNTGEEIIQASNSMPVFPGQKPGIQHQLNGQSVFSVWSGDRLPTQQSSNHEPIKPHILPQYKPNFGSVHELAENVNRLQNSPNSKPNRPQTAVIQHGFHEIKEPSVTASHQPTKEQFPAHVHHSSPANEKENQGNQNNDYVIVGHITPQVSVDDSRFKVVNNKNEGNTNNPILIGENVALSPKLEEILHHSSKNENNPNKVLTEKESTNIIHSSQNSKTKQEEQKIIHKPSDLYNDRTNIENLSPPPPKVNEFFHEQTFDSREPVINPSLHSYKPNFENNSPFEINIGSPIEISSELRPPVLNVPHFVDKKPINKNKPLSHVPVQVNDQSHGLIPNISHISVSLEDSINKQHIPGQLSGIPFNKNERFPPKDPTLQRDKVPILTFDLQTQGSSPSPFTIRPIIDDSVVGLSPPPPRVTINSNGRFPTSSAESKDSTHRPALPGGHRKPIPAQFPPPPYEFERPPPSTVTEKSHMKIPPIDGPIFHDTVTTAKTKLISKDEIEDEDDQVLAETSAGNKSPINHGVDIVYTPPAYTTYHPRPVKPLTPKYPTTERTTTKRITTQSNITTPKPITKSTPSSLSVIVGRPVIHNPPPPPPPPPPEISPTPTKAVQKDSTNKGTITDQLWNIPNIIIGSEVNFESSSKDQNSVTIENTSRPTINVHYVVSGSKTVFNDVNIRPTKNQLFPSKVVEPNGFSQILTVVDGDNEDNNEELNKKTTDLGVASSNENQIIFGSNDDSSSANAVIPTHYLTHTHTLTVTTTETTVVSSEGHQPLTKTVVLTKTQTSTVVDTVTETQTLVRPTSVVQTVTTTVSTTIAQYPPGSPFDPENYPTFPTKLTSTTTVPSTQKPISELPLPTEASTNDKPQENKDPETFFVIVNDQQQKLPPLVTMPGSHLPPGIIEYETGKDEEEGDNGPPGGGSPQTNVLLSAGVISPTSCRPDCIAAKNEVCQRVEGHMRCVCRPGFARMFLDRPCKPTYTYTLRLALQRIGNEKLHYNNVLSDHSSSDFRHLAGSTGEGLDRLVMQSDLRDIFHGVTVASFDPVTVGPVSVSKPGQTEPGVVVSFHVQLSDNTDENRLKEVFRKSLRTNNFSLGGTEVYADQELIQHLEAEDFDECTSQQYHDCSEHAHCFNLRGTYTCSCKEGYADLSENTLFPGRVCSAELIGCEKCHYHGTCHSRGDDQILCECFQWYAGETCHINLKALLIALVTIGAVLLVLLVVCIILTCLRRGGRRRGHKGRTAGGTLDRRAMIQDTSSESSLDNAPLAYSLPRQQTPVAVFGKKATTPKVVAVVPAATGTMQSMGFPEQRDRSLTVMIPRAKYRPVPPTSPLLTMSTFGAEEKRAIAQEHKLLAFLESGGKPHESHQMNSKRKQSNTTNQTSEPQSPRKISAPRKQSVVNPAPGALVSAGFEVSATVGKVLDSDTETSAMVHNGSTLRTADSLHNTEENLATSPKAESGVEELTVSEARSCDETTIQPPTKRLHSNYSSKQSSNNLNNDEGHTMAERDVGSTFMMPQSHLYTPDRGSDISNFDSL